MDRRRLMQSGIAGALIASAPLARASEHPTGRVRPGDAGWPDEAAWSALAARVGGRLVKVISPLKACAAAAAGDPVCAKLFEDLRNPFFIGDNVALTQTLGWTDAWTSEPSAYAVAARTAEDVAAAVNFARERRLRLVVKGGGHSYLGGSNAADSLLIWTKAMNRVELLDSFVPKGGEGRSAPQPAVNVGAGAIWLEAYQAVTTQGGRYVQGGGCTTVGVAGLVQGGGFGSFSKRYGTGAASLLEAEIVTADGAVRVVNAYQDPDLFWAIKGGGGGTFGVVTRLTLRTHELPNFFGAVRTLIVATSDDAYRALVDQLLGFYEASLMNPHWGEQIGFQGGYRVSISMVFQGLDQAGAQAVWQPLFDWLSARPADYHFFKPTILAVPAAHFWDAHLLKSLPGVVRSDNRPDAPAEHFFWDGDAGQVGQVLHGYRSVWLSKSLLTPERRGALVDALVRTAGAWGVSLHCNKGLAGAPDEALAASAATATNPAVLDAFALAISGAGEGPAYPGVAGHEPDAAAGRRDAKALAAAMAPLEALPARPASYISETDYFEADWQAAFWGENYRRLRRIKDRYDPSGLFFVHHAVGSEDWSADGFQRNSPRL